MTSHPRWLAASLIGVSCAAGPGRGGAPVIQPPPAVVPGPPQKVSEAALGPIKVTKWRLGNGLLVVLAPDPRARSVSYQTWFRVGSRHEDEAAGETGLAHLFEHLMFTQTKRDKEPGEFDRRMEEAGAHVNAMTFYDFTAYIDDLPSEALPLAVELESDRMVNLTLGDEQVSTEREVVAEERLQSVEDDVDGLLEEKLWSQAFERHPYKWPIIGWMKDIKAVTREKAMRFYRTFYAPNNAVVVIAGRFDEGRALALVDERYGKLAPSALPVDGTAPEVAPQKPVRADLDRPVPADRVAVGLPAPGLPHVDRAAYDLLATMLTGGPSARLYRKLVVEDAVASSVRGDVSPTKDHGLFTIWVQLREGHAAAEAEAAITAAAAELATRAVPVDELERARNIVLGALWGELDHSTGRAERLGHFEIATGDFKNLGTRLDDYARVSAEDVLRVARTWLGGGARTTVVAHPKP